MAAQRAFRPEPSGGRVFRTRRVVRSTDVTPGGRLRFDALARYLQWAAEDDVHDAGLAEPVGWLARRCELAIAGLPALGDGLAVATFCSATGPRWAERTTTLSTAEGPLLQATAVWAAVGQGDGRPVPLSADFMRVYGSAAAGRTVSARLSHRRPERLAGARDWPLRAADLDPAGHVNNAVHWAAVEEFLAAADGWLPASAELEYHRAILPGSALRLVTAADAGQARLWLVAGDLMLASARLSANDDGSHGSPHGFH